MADSADGARRVSNSSVEDKVRRLRRLETEVEVNKRARHSEAVTLHKALQSITDSDVVSLSGAVPLLARVTKFTLEDIENNSNGEVQAIRDLLTSLTAYTEEMLSHFEEMLC